MLTHLRATRDHTPGWIYTPATPAFFFTGGYCCKGPATLYHTFCGNKAGAIPLQTTQRWDGTVWATRTDCPLPARFGLATARYGSGVVILGGGAAVAPGVLQDTELFVNNSWSSETDCPPPGKQFLSAAAIGTTVLSLAGQDSGGNLRSENLALSASTWSTRLPVLGPARRFACTAGSQSQSNLFGGASAVAASLNRNDAYTLLSDTWTSRVPLPAPSREGAVTFSLNDTAVIVGGGIPLFTDVDRYRFATDVWTADQDLPVPARHWAGGAADSFANLGWITGGQNQAGTRLSDHDEFSTNTWLSRIDLPLDPRMWNASEMA